MSNAYAHHIDDCTCLQCEQARHTADQIIKLAMERADREIAKRGIPQIAARPLIRPYFTMTAGKGCERWVTENIRMLFDWYHATMDAAADDETWPIFCAEQFYQQQMLDELTGELKC